MFSMPENTCSKQTAHSKKEEEKVVLCVGMYLYVYIIIIIIMYSTQLQSAYSAVLLYVELWRSAC